MKIFFLLSLSLIMNQTAAAAAEMCQDLFSNKPALATAQNDTLPSENQQKALIQFNHISEYLLQLGNPGTKAPSWPDYNEVDLLLKIAKNLNSLDKEILKKATSEDHQRLVNKAEQNKKDLFYRPFLDAHYNYFRLLNEINTILKFQLFPDFGLKQVKSNEQTVEIASRIISDLTKKYEDNFSDLGHKNLEQFRAYAENYSAYSNWVIQNLRDNTQVALHRPEGARFWIPLTGFQNQRTTGSSKGWYAPGSEARNDTESALLKLNSEAYNLVSVRTMPNYAELRYDFKKVPQKPHQNANVYGSDLWIIKKDVLNKRATVTPADSLGNQEDSESVVSKSFIPWKFRELVTPFLVSPTVLNTLNENAEAWNRRPDDFTFKSLWIYYISYVEVQIFGSLTLDDVSAFHFKQDPPDKEFYNLLKSKNIEVYDERQWPPVKWEPKD